MSRLTLCLVLLPCVSFAKPWQGIMPGVSLETNVVAKFGEPTKRLSAGAHEVLLFAGLQAIKGTVQAQFKCDPATHQVQRIDVYPEPVIDRTEIEKSYGQACLATAGVEPCYWPKETPQKQPYFLYLKLGLVIFFKDDGKTVRSFAFLPQQP